MSPAWCYFGGKPGAAVLALLPSKTPISLGGENYLGVLIPSAPVPFGGALVYVPAAWIEPAEGGIDELMSVYVSMGITPPGPGASKVAGPDGRLASSSRLTWNCKRQRIEGPTTLPSLVLIGRKAERLALGDGADCGCFRNPASACGRGVPARRRGACPARANSQSRRPSSVASNTP